MGGRYPEHPEHLTRLEQMYEAAAINRFFPSRLHMVKAGRAEIRFTVTEEMFHAAGAAHGTVYFKMLDDAAFYAANSMVEDNFVLTTQFSLLLMRPVGTGELRAIGEWVSGRRRVLLAEAQLVNAHGEEVARGQGTFMRSRIPLRSLPGYGDPLPEVGGARDGKV